TSPAEGRLATRMSSSQRTRRGLPARVVERYALPLALAFARSAFGGDSAVVLSSTSIAPPPSFLLVQRAPSGPSSNASQNAASPGTHVATQASGSRAAASSAVTFVSPASWTSVFRFSARPVVSTNRLHAVVAPNPSNTHQRMGRELPSSRRSPRGEVVTLP